MVNCSPLSTALCDVIQILIWNPIWQNLTLLAKPDLHLEQQIPDHLPGFLWCLEVEPAVWAKCEDF